MTETKSTTVTETVTIYNWYDTDCGRYSWYQPRISLKVICNGFSQN